MDWTSLRAWVAGRFEVIGELDGGALVTFRRADSDIKLGLRRMGDWAFLVVKIGPVDHLRALAATEQTFERPIGAFFSHAGALGFGQKLPLRGLEGETVAEVIDALLATAAEVRDQYLQPGAPADLFDHFSD